MKWIQFNKATKLYEDEANGIGIQWFMGRDNPPTTFRVEDRSYRSSFYLIFALISKRWMLEVQLWKMPYTNKEEYISWLRQKRTRNKKTSL